MVQITTNTNNIVFEIMGWHKLWCLKNSITIPKEKIIKAYQDNSEITFWKGFRMPGTEIPGLIAAGNFYKNGRNFWDVSNNKNVIIITLRNHYYKKLIIEVNNPAQALKQINIL